MFAKSLINATCAGNHLSPCFKSSIASLLRWFCNAIRARMRQASGCRGSASSRRAYCSSDASIGCIIFRGGNYQYKLVLSGLNITKLGFHLQHTRVSAARSKMAHSVLEGQWKMLLREIPGAWLANAQRGKLRFANQALRDLGCPRSVERIHCNRSAVGVAAMKLNAICRPLDATRWNQPFGRNNISFL